MQFRLAMLFDAPRDVLRDLEKAVCDSEEAVVGLVYTLEWKFYQALFLLRYGTDEDKVKLDDNISFLQRHTLCEFAVFGTIADLQPQIA